MTTPSDEIVERYRQRKTDRGEVIGRMEQVRLQYNGDIVVPLPELDKNEKPAAVNLLGPGLDQLAMRIASTSPDVDFARVKTGFDKWEEKARDSRRAVLGWWDMNQIGIKDRYRARHLLAYGCSPITVSAVPTSPLDKRDIPHWRVRNPLECYPSPRNDETDFEPLDCVFCYRQSRKWLCTLYPDAAGALGKLDKDPKDDDRIDVLEFNDADETVLIALGTMKPEQRTGPFAPRPAGPPTPTAAPFVELSRVPNLAQIPLTVMAGRVTLDRMQGAFDQILGIYQRAAKLDALETISIFRSVFPEQWLQSHPQSPGSPRIIEQADGKTGTIGIVENGAMQNMVLQPSLQVGQALDRMERTQRLQAGLPPEFGGESGSNIRTARRGEMVMGAAVDMPIQEHQEVLAASKEAEIRRAIAISKAYHGSKPTSFYLPRSGKIPVGATPDYTPNDTFVIDDCFVKYSMPGADANGQEIAVGQRVNLGTMSVQTAMEMDPMVEDPTRELAQIESEALRRALLTSIENAAQQGQVDPPTIAGIITELRDRDSTHLEDAVIKVHEQMQAKQAAQQQAPPPPGAPEAQPGMTGAPPPAAPPTKSPQGLAQILGALRQPTQQSPSETQLVGAGGGQ